MMIYTSVQKYFREIYFLLVGALGLALGSLAATIVAGLLEPSANRVVDVKPAATIVAPPPALSSFDVILQRNLFNASVGGASSAKSTPAKTGMVQTASRRTDLALIGVVVAGDRSLAVVRSGKDEKIYRPGATVPGGGILSIVERRQVTIDNTDGSQTILPLYKDTVSLATATKAAATRKGSAIRSVGDNRWVIPRAEAERARGNLNELLKQARMEPVTGKNGKTDGFIVKMIRPRSLLALLGIKKGDLLKSVNGMALDSPEKALQVFQQLREANNINIDLMRQGTPHSFEYAIN